MRFNQISIISVQAFVLSCLINGTAIAELPRTILTATLDKKQTAIIITYTHGQSHTERVQTQGETFGKPAISSDRNIVGWSVNRIDGASYAYPEWLQFVGYGAQRHIACDAGIVWGWRFYGNHRVVIECGFPHGNTARMRELVVISTGKTEASVNVKDNGSVDPHAPAWAHADIVE